MHFAPAKPSTFAIGGTAARPVGAGRCEAAGPAAEGELDGVAVEAGLAGPAVLVLCISSLTEAVVLRALTCCSSGAALLTELCSNR